MDENFFCFLFNLKSLYQCFNSESCDFDRCKTFLYVRYYKKKKKKLKTYFLVTSLLNNYDSLKKNNSYRFVSNIKLYLSKFNNAEFLMKY